MCQSAGNSFVATGEKIESERNPAGISSERIEHSMKIQIAPLLCLTTLVSISLAQTPASNAPVQVMVLGTYHFANPGQDLHNMKVDNVLTPEKQAELADLAERLARFKPTKIAVEAVSDRADLTTKKFDGFTRDMLTKDPDERVQVAFRLAQQLGQNCVYGIDEQSDKIDYFPFDKIESYAKAHNESERLDRLHAQVEQIIKRMEAEQKTTPVRKILARLNDPAQIIADHREFYYALLPLGTTAEQPGADLNGAWYLGNAKIFAKLTQIASPGARLLVVFGSGHGYWLRHFVQNTPGFQLIEPVDYLH